MLYCVLYFREKQLEEYLDAKGIKYAETKELILIDGVFDKDVVIAKPEIVHNAAKFLSPEEEAALRQAEILKLKNNANSSSEESDDDIGGSSADQDVEASNITKTPSKITSSIAQFEHTPVSKSVTKAYCTPSKRRSVLDSVDPSLVLSLNKSLKRHVPNTVEREGRGDNNSTLLAERVLFQDGSGFDENNRLKACPTTPSQPKKQVQSRLLKKMMQRSSGTNDEATPPENNISSTPKLSFLDQIKMKSKSSNPMSGDTSMTDSAPPKPAMSFLDQIKMRNKG